MSNASYTTRKANRLATAGATEQAYVEMRRTLEHVLESSPPQNGRFVAVLTREERLLEALSQRVGPQQVLDVMEQRWPYPGQRIDLVKQIARTTGNANLQVALNGIELRYGLVRPTVGPPSPLSVIAQPSVSTMPPSLPPQPAPPLHLEAGNGGDIERRRQIAVSTLSDLERGKCRDLAFGLGLTIGFVDDLDRSSSSNREAVRRMLDGYFRSPPLHKGDQFGTLIRALRELNLNMTADRLSDDLRW